MDASIEEQGLIKGLGDFSQRNLLCCTLSSKLHMVFQQGKGNQIRWHTI